MDENIIIQPINGDGYTIEITEQDIDPLTLETQPTEETYTIIIENESGESIAEIYPEENNNTIDVFSIDTEPQTVEFYSLVNDLYIELFVGIDGGRISLTGHVTGEEQAGIIYTVLEKESITEQDTETPQLSDNLLIYDYSLGKLAKTDLTSIKSLINEDTFLDSIDDNLNGLFDFNLSDGTQITLDLSAYENVQSDWNDNDPASDAYIKNIKNIKSFTGADLTNRQTTLPNDTGSEAPFLVLFKDGERVMPTEYQYSATTTEITITVNVPHTDSTTFTYRLL